MDSEEFKKICGQFATGVAIITAQNHADKPVGLTINSFASVSLNPALISVCLDKKINNLDAFTSDKGFAIQFLAHDQHAISARFAQTEADKFSTINWQQDDSSLPLIENVIGYMLCQAYHHIEAGDHMILIGKALKSQILRPTTPPLLYFRGAYAQMQASVKTETLHNISKVSYD